MEDVTNYAERVDETHDLVVEEVAEKAEESWILRKCYERVDTMFMNIFQSGGCRCCVHLSPTWKFMILAPRKK